MNKNVEHIIKYHPRRCHQQREIDLLTYPMYNIYHKYLQLKSMHDEWHDPTDPTPSLRDYGTVSERQILMNMTMELVRVSQHLR